jgi:SAM-dependent methyltransferase
MRATRVVRLGVAYRKAALGHLAAVRAYCRPLTTRRCPACASKRVTLIDVIPASGRLNAFGTAFVSGCRACGLLFVNPMPTHAFLEAIYAPDGVWAHGRTDPVPGDDPAARSSTYLRHLLAPASEVLDITRPRPGAGVLDIGCGRGRTLDALAALGWLTFGLDPSDKRAFPRHQELATLPDVPSFELIVLHHVIEHVDAPLDLLHGAWRALHDNGVLLVSVPRLDTVSEHRDLKYCISPSTHVLSYSRDCLYGLLRRAGFEPLDAASPADRKADRRSVKRLRMLGVKRPHSRPHIRRPLRAAKRALAGFHDVSGDGWRFRYVPARIRGLEVYLRRRAGRSG